MVRVVQRDGSTIATLPSMYSHYVCAYVGVRWDREGAIADFETLRRGIGMLEEVRNARINAKVVELNGR